MTGTYEHSLDSAGRLIVPSKLREELGSQFYLAVGVKENLTLYPMAAWNKLQERVANLTTAQAAACQGWRTARGLQNKRHKQADLANGRPICVAFDYDPIGQMPGKT